jgi:hypothetical protein
MCAADWEDLKEAICTQLFLLVFGTVSLRLNRSLAGDLNEPAPAPELDLARTPTPPSTNSRSTS